MCRLWYMRFIVPEESNRDEGLITKTGENSLIINREFSPVFCDKPTMNSYACELAAVLPRLNRWINIPLYPILKADFNIYHFKRRHGNRELMAFNRDIRNFIFQKIAQVCIFNRSGKG